MVEKQLWIVFDIDGVLTDGTVCIGTDGTEFKRLNFKDIDALYELSRMGCKIAAITSEKNTFSQWAQRRFPWEVFEDGVTNKSERLAELRSSQEICEGSLVYVGDGKKDISAFSQADFTICPKDAIADIRERADIVLPMPAGAGALWEIVRWVKRNKLVNINDSILQEEAINDRQLLVDTIEQHRIVLSQIQKDAILSYHICSVGTKIVQAIQQRKKVLLFGNGGSAADAQHIAAEFVGRFLTEREPWNVMALTTNSSILTAISNDYSFQQVFSRQVAALADKGDVVIGLSTSGSSDNVRLALDEARRRGACTVLLTGQACTNSPADITIPVPSFHTPIIQEMHIVIGHFWADYAEKRINSLELSIE